MRVQVFLLLLLLTVSSLTFAAENPFMREANITINYSKVPWVLLGVTPKLVKPEQLVYDTITKPEEPPRLDPRTCVGEVALCYQIIVHDFRGELTYGKNYSATSSYILPDKRVRQSVCVGDNHLCVRSATNCWCPPIKEPQVTPILGRTEKCSDTLHLCRDSLLTFTLCDLPLEECKERYVECGCGRHATCTATTYNTCLNDRDEVTMCRGSISTCLTKFPSCFCGQQAMNLQQGCTTRNHECERDGEQITCHGKFTECALQNDVCLCGNA